MGHRESFTVEPDWSFPEFLEQLYSHCRGGCIQGTGYRLNAMCAWLSMVTLRDHRYVDFRKNCRYTRRRCKNWWMTCEGREGRRRLGGPGVGGRRSKQAAATVDGH